MQEPLLARALGPKAARPRVREMIGYLGYKLNIRIINQKLIMQIIY